MTITSPHQKVSNACCRFKNHCEVRSFKFLFVGFVLIMEKLVQLKTNRYMCLRMLEDECNFKSICIDDENEKVYSQLKRFYKPVTFSQASMLRTCSLTQEDYHTLTATVLKIRNNCSPLYMSSFITLYLVTKHVIMELTDNKKRSQLCVWLNHLYDNHEIDWNNIFRYRISTQ